MRNLDILFEDNSVIIVNKPSGLAVQGGKGVKNSVDSILAQARPNAAFLVHRLDKDTSGVLLVAKSKQAAARFSRLFGGAVVKQYIAVCADFRDRPEKEGVISADLKAHNKLKKAQTKYKVIKNGKISDVEIAVMQIELVTGRMHQIRRHLAMIGCPILGDDKYGNFKLNKELRINKLMLHARRIIIKEENIDVEAPLPLRILDTI